MADHKYVRVPRGYMQTTFRLEVAVYNMIAVKIFEAHGYIRNLMHEGQASGTCRQHGYVPRQYD
jgi:hypothetical protein